MNPQKFTVKNTKILKITLDQKKATNKNTLAFGFYTLFIACSF